MSKARCESLIKRERKSNKIALLKYRNFSNFKIEKKKNFMKTYKKVHTLKKVLDKHVKAIKKRGGSYKIEGMEVTYTFKKK